MFNLGPPSDEVQRDLPLALLEEADEDEIHGITRFQKLVFILQQGDLIDDRGLPKESRFNYKPHNYGPYSKELHDWLDYLDEEGIINKKQKKTPAGNQKEIFTLQSEPEDIELDATTREKVKNTVEKFNDMSLLELLDQVYEEYPDYTTESKL